jgi:hypothetical protein
MSKLFFSSLRSNCAFGWSPINICPPTFSLVSTALPSLGNYTYPLRILWWYLKCGILAILTIHYMLDDTSDYEFPFEWFFKPWYLWNCNIYGFRFKLVLSSLHLRFLHQCAEQSSILSTRTGPIIYLKSCWSNKSTSARHFRPRRSQSHCDRLSNSAKLHIADSSFFNNQSNLMLRSQDTHFWHYCLRY